MSVYLFFALFSAFLITERKSARRGTVEGGCLYERQQRETLRGYGCMLNITNICERFFLSSNGGRNYSEIQ